MILRLRPLHACAAALLAAVFSAVVLAQQLEPVATRPAAIPITTTAATRSDEPATRQAVQAYRWRLIDDGAGGDATGMVFHPLDASFRYLQSSHTGGYRWDYEAQRWLCFTDSHRDPAFGHVAGIAIDPRDRNVLHFAAGRPRGDIFRSVDRGKTFEPAHLQKADGRQVYIDGGDATAGYGERLVVDPNNSAVVYFASRFDGLWRSDRSGAADSWRQVESFAARGDTINVHDRRGRVIRKSSSVGGLSLVAIDPAGGTLEIDQLKLSRVVYVGVVGDRREQRGGHGEPVDQIEQGGLWRSNDGGQTWTLLSGPLDADNAATQARVAADGTVFATISGRVVRASATVGRVSDLAVSGGPDGFLAIAIDPADPKHVVAARRGPAIHSIHGRLVRTVDGGGTWIPLKTAFDYPPWLPRSFRSPTHFLQFEPNAPRDDKGRTKVLWLGDSVGPWVSTDLDAQRSNWKLISRGRGGLAVTSLATPPAVPGDVIAPLLATADGIGGFRYVGFTVMPQHTLTGRTTDGEPLSAATSVAFCEKDSRFVAVVGSGGVRVSVDNGQSWFVAGKPVAADEAQGGYVAVGAELQPSGVPAIVWMPANAAPRYSLDWGRTWQECGGKLPVPALGETLEASAAPIAADAVDGRTFYHFSDNSDDAGFAVVSVSDDAGATWRQVGRFPYGAKRRRMTLHQLRSQPGQKAALWLSLADPFTNAEKESTQGLHRSVDGGRTWTRLAGWQQATAVAFGAAAPGRSHPAMVAAGTYRGRVGVFISDDVAAPVARRADEESSSASWRQIWDIADTQVPAMARALRHLGADRQTYGRVFAGGSSTDASVTPAPLSGRGIFYGEPVIHTIPSPVTNLVVTPEPAAASAGGRVVVEWTEPIGGGVYDVERVPADLPNQWQTVSASGWYGRFVDAPVKPGRYVYRVTAANALGRSDAVSSAVVEVKSITVD